MRNLLQLQIQESQQRQDEEHAHHMTTDNSRLAQARLEQRNAKLKEAKDQAARKAHQQDLLGQLEAAAKREAEATSFKKQEEDCILEVDKQRVLEDRQKLDRDRQTRVVNALFNKSVGEQLSLRKLQEHEASLKDDPKPLKRKVKKTYARGNMLDKNDDGRTSSKQGQHGGLMRQFFTRTTNPSHTLFKRAEIRAKNLGEPIALKKEEQATKEKQWLDKLELEVKIKLHEKHEREKRER